MATYLATWGGPGPRVFTAPIAQPAPTVVVQPAISDGAFRRKKKRRVETITQPVQPAKREVVVSAIAIEPKHDFRSLAELSGKSVETFRAEIDREIAHLFQVEQERDDEEALTLILSTLEDEWPN